MEPKFVHYDLKLIEPAFGSNLTDLIIELDYLRKKHLRGTTHPKVFYQLKHIFHTLESISSARIEGNNTTIAEYIETKIKNNENKPQSIKEIQNIENAMTFIEETIKENPINKAYISHLHKLIVEGLTTPPEGEGDRTPGVYRMQNPIIAHSTHLPPDFTSVDSYMEELFSFINKEDKPKYDLLKAAIAHHRFVWIHPFSNGNGRTVRLLTYAMLIKNDFSSYTGRIINPTAVFCNNRNQYYLNLAKADTGNENGILAWTEYVLSGLKLELEKIDKLTDYEYLKKEILLPTIKYSIERKFITDSEASILKLCIEKQLIQAADLKSIFQTKSNSMISREIKKLVEKNMLTPEKENSRKYVIRFDNNYLLRGIYKNLGDKGFLPSLETY